MFGVVSCSSIDSWCSPTIGKLGEKDRFFCPLVVSERLVMLCLEKELAGVCQDDQEGGTSTGIGSPKGNCRG